MLQVLSIFINCFLAQIYTVEMDNPKIFPICNANSEITHQRLKQEEYLDFTENMQSPRSVSPVGSLGSSASSIYHDALGDREEFWKPMEGNWIWANKDDNLNAKNEISKLMQSLEEQNQEIETLYAKIGTLNKTAQTATSKFDVANKKLQKARDELETFQNNIAYALDSGSVIESGLRSPLRTWCTQKLILWTRNQEFQKYLAEIEALVESLRFQVDLQREEIQRLGKANEEDDTAIKNQKGKSTPSKGYC